MSLVGKAKARPDQVAKVVQSAASLGPIATYRKVMNKLDSYTPLGYSLCGEVVEVGDGITDVAVGDLVACAGNEHALHAELNWVPKNLYTRVPGGVEPRARGVRHGRLDRDAGRPPGRVAARRAGAGGRPRPDRPAGGAAAGGIRGAGGRRRPRPDPLRAGRAASARWSAATPARASSTRPSASCRTATASTRSTWRRAAAATTPSSWPPSSRATAAGSSTSARPGWTCRGTPTTRRSWTSGSRARTGPGATTPNTSSTAATIRSATSAGPSAATWSASSTWSRAARVDVGAADLAHRRLRHGRRRPTGSSRAAS